MLKVTLPTLVDIVCTRGTCIDRFLLLSFGYIFLCVSKNGGGSDRKGGWTVYTIFEEREG